MKHNQSAQSQTTSPQPNQSRELQDLRGEVKAMKDDLNRQLTQTSEMLQKRIQSTEEAMVTLRRTPQQASGSYADAGELKVVESRLKTSEANLKDIIKQVDIQRSKSSALFSHMSKRSKAWAGDAAGPKGEGPQWELVGPEQVHEEVERSSIRLSTGLFDPTAGRGAPAGAADGNGSRDLVGEMSAIRAVLVELHVSVGVHAVRMTATALRTFELSPEERANALKELDQKEGKLREDLGRIRGKTKDYTDKLLVEMLHRKADLTM